MKTKPSESGAYGVLLVFCLALLAAGLGFDFLAGARPRFWIGGEGGAAAMIGAGAVVAAFGAAYIARLVLARRTRRPRGKGGHADADA